MLFHAWVAGAPATHKPCRSSRLIPAATIKLPQFFSCSKNVLCLSEAGARRPLCDRRATRRRRPDRAQDHHRHIRRLGRARRRRLLRQGPHQGRPLRRLHRPPGRQVHRRLRPRPPRHRPGTPKSFCYLASAFLLFPFFLYLEFLSITGPAKALSRCPLPPPEMLRGAMSLVRSDVSAITLQQWSHCKQVLFSPYIYVLIVPRAINRSREVP
jgi:hypothetical protein